MNPSHVLSLVLMVSFALAVPSAEAAEGKASWYCKKSPGVKKYTANGERFDDTQRTCASWHYKFGTRLKVTNLKTGKSVVCRVNDRGPSKKLKNRIIDLSRSTFRQIGDLRQGLIPVSVTPL